MATNKNEDQPIMGDMHAVLEKSLIEAYLMGKGFSLEKLKKLPKAEAKRLMTEASIYASGKLAELEERAHFMDELHDAYSEE
jgi:hypothetical protein